MTRAIQQGKLAPHDPALPQRPDSGEPQRRVLSGDRRQVMRRAARVTSLYSQAEGAVWNPLPASEGGPEAGDQSRM